jgi:hypothetical protein
MSLFIDASDTFTKEFYESKEIYKGKVLIFSTDDGDKHYKIVRLNRRKRKCFLEETKLYNEKELKRKLQEDEVAERLGDG